MDFSFEYMAERIPNPKTKEYFIEVLTCYSAGCYRSAIVMLYSVVICDLIYKLSDLRDMYEDKKAEGILKDIDQEQNLKPQSPEWEKTLIEHVKESTNLLEPSDYVNVLSLQKHRHLSAHPVLNNIDILFSPNKETVRAHMRNMLEGVLIKPAILSRKVLDYLLLDLATHKDSLIDYETTKRYLESKYLKNMVPEVEYKLFRDLWKLVFRLTDNDCVINRNINSWALRIIFQRHSTELTKLIQEEPVYYSNIGSEDTIIFLIIFLSENPILYKALNDQTHILIKDISNKYIDFYILSWFFEDDFQKHVLSINDVYNKCSNKDVTIYSINRLYNKACELDQQAIVCDLLIWLFSVSYEFDCADYRYSSFIKPYLDFFNREQLVDLLNAVENNGQIKHRNRSTNSNREIKERVIKVIGKDFDFSHYPSFSRISIFDEFQDFICE